MPFIHRNSVDLENGTARVPALDPALLF